MSDAIESEAKLENRLLLVTAPGGMGKTTTACKLMTLWARDGCLRDIFAVIRIDMKQVNYQKDLFDNMLSQYPSIRGAFTKEELAKIKESFCFSQN